MRAYHVERPRASDAVALSLRNAFGRDTALTEEMVMLLHCLNRFDLPLAR